MKRLTPILILLGLILVSSTIAALHSNAVLKWVLVLADQQLPMDLRTGEVEGTLAGPIAVSGLHLQIEDFQLDATHLEFDWWLGDLLLRRLSLKRLDASDVVIALPPGDPQAEPAAPGLPTLPITLDIRGASIRGLTLGDPAQPLLLASQLHVAVKWNEGGLTVEQLNLQRQGSELAGEVRIAQKAPHALGANLTWQLSQGTGPALSGESTLSGNLQLMESSHVLRSPFPAILNLNARLHPAPVALEGTLEARAVNLHSLVGGLPREPFTLQLAYQLEGQRGLLNGMVELSPWPAISLELDARLQDSTVILQPLTLAPLGKPGELAVNGELSLDLTAESHLDASWQDLDLDELLEGLLSSGGLSLRGTPEAYDLAVHLEALASGYPPVSLQASAKGDKSMLHVESLDASVLGGQLRGHGDVNWADGLRIDSRLQASGLDPALLRPGLRGSLGLDATLGIIPAGAGSRITVDINSLHGQAGPEHLAGRGQLVFDPSGIAAKGIDLQLGDGRILASGHLGETLDFTAKATGLKPKAWVPATAGTFDAQMSLQGSRGRPRLQATVTADAPVFQQWQARAANTTLSLDLSDSQVSTLNFSIEELVQAEQVIGTLSGDAKGRAAHHRLSAQLQGPLVSAETILEGSYQDKRWAAVVSMLDLGLSQLGPEPWRLKGSALLGVTPAALEVRGLCLMREQANACLDGEYLQEQGASARSVLKNFPLQSLDLLLGETANLTGTASGQGELRIGARGQLTGEGALSVKAGSVNWTTHAGMPVSLDVPSLHMNWKADADQLGGSLLANLGENDFTEIELLMQRRTGAAESWPAKGKFSVHLGALARYGHIVPELEDLAGSLDSDLVLAGTLAEPLVSGTASLAGFTTFIPELGTQISDVSLHIAGTQKRTELEARALVGGGQANLKGMLGWAEGQARASFTLRGSDLKLVERPDIMLIASPDVSLDLQGRKLMVTGRVTVPAADIKPVDISGAVRSSPDTMLVDANGEVMDNGALRITTDVTVELGDAVHFAGYGLTTDLRGSLRVRDRPEQITTGRGELKVQNGHYKLYGLDLQIERGQVLYADGPIDNPGLSIRAVREKDEVRVGADVGGTLREPTLSFFSSPAMPQSEIIAYLITGKPMSSLDTASEQRVSAIGDALALAGGNLLSGEIGARVGLDELALRTTEQTGGSELVLGKYLSPKLFVSYGIGLYESLNSLRVRYQINDRLSVRTESGLYESVDIFWSQER